MAQFHFVEDYEAHVATLLKLHKRDEAMSLAVGGLYREVGEIEQAILRHAGLQDGMSVIDLGCGSGRLAHVLSESMKIDYLGTDVIQVLLDYAKSKCKKNYKFVLHREISIPAADASADMICAFSVFTHLLQEETYLYLEDMKRVLKPGGKIIFSFLEFGSNTDIHWHIFEATMQARKQNARPHLNMFNERTAIESWCRHLQLDVIEFIDGNAAPHGAKALGQSVAILTPSAKRQA